jgi:hypothetical protein
VRRGTQLRIVEAEDAMLHTGSHSFEADNGFSWTDGDATLPIKLFDGFTGPLVVELTVADTMQYRDEDRRPLA